MQGVAQQRSSSQVEAALAGTSSTTLLDAWGSQDHASCQLILSPRDAVSLLFDGTHIDPAQQAGHSATMDTTVGQALAAINGMRPYSESGLCQRQQLYSHQSQENQGLKAIIHDDACHLGSLQQVQWQVEQHHRHHQQPSSALQYQQQLIYYQQEHSSCESTSAQHPQQQQLVPQKLEQSIPCLDLSRVKIGSCQPVRNLADNDVATPQAASKEAELCFEAGSIREHQLHPNALLQDSRCYIYRAVGRQEVHEFQALLSRLPAREHAAVSSLWDALLVARHDCEVMAARGVRVSRDISRDWQETVADLIDRVVAQDQDLAQLKQQLKSAQVAAQAAASNSSPGTTVCGPEELHAQVVRLKRQRDKLSRDQQDLVRMLGESQQAEHLAMQKSVETRAQLDAVKLQAQHLRDQHMDLLHRNLELASIADSLERQVEALEAAAAVAGAGSNKELQLAAGIQMVQQATGGGYTATLCSSGGGADQPRSDQTSVNARPSSPASTAKAGSNAVKGGGRHSPFADERQQLSSPRTAGHVATLAAARPGKVHSHRQASSNAGALGRKPATSQHHAAHVGQGEANHANSIGNHTDAASAPVAVFKGLGPMVWGSGGGASYTGSNGGFAVGRSSLGLSSTGGDSSSGMAHSGAAGGDAKCHVGAGTNAPRSSDDTLDTSRIGVSHGYTTLSKESDQYDQQVDMTAGTLQSGLPLAPGMLGGFAAASQVPGGSSVVGGVYGSVQTPGPGGAKPPSRLMVQQREISVVPSVLSAESHNDWQKEIEIVRQQLQTIEAISFL